MKKNSNFINSVCTSPYGDYLLVQCYSHKFWMTDEKPDWFGKYGRQNYLLILNTQDNYQISNHYAFDGFCGNLLLSPDNSTLLASSAWSRFVFYSACFLQMWNIHFPKSYAKNIVNGIDAPKVTFSNTTDYNYEGSL